MTYGGPGRSPQVLGIWIDRRLRFGAGLGDRLDYLDLCHPVCAKLIEGLSMNILIIGGTGLISSAIAQFLLARGDAVTCYNRGRNGRIF
jgi:hypothetical protein